MTVLCMGGRQNSSPIRPVVFEDPGKVTDEVVQFHLEQQVVQGPLSRFLAQGFQLDDLSRACLAQTRDDHSFAIDVLDPQATCSLAPPHPG